MKLAALAIVILAAARLQAAAPSCPAVTPATTPAMPWDTSGNAMLTGKTYFFRYVQYTVGDQFGDLSRAIGLFQQITFNTDGITYSITGTELDSNSQNPLCSFTEGGHYYISSSGFGFLSNPLYPGDQIWGMVSPKNGVFIGSTTETQNSYNDLFVAAPEAMPQATNSTLSGAYSLTSTSLGRCPVTATNLQRTSKLTTLVASIKILLKLLIPEGQGTTTGYSPLSFIGGLTENVSADFGSEPPFDTSELPVRDQRFASIFAAASDRSASLAVLYTHRFLRRG